ncbi:carbohydrate-binding CenC domain protein, partial [candidate division TM7 genomosp. GTL1]
TITSTGAGNDIVLNSADTIALQDDTTISGALTVTGSSNFQGGVVNVGTASQLGALTLFDGTGNTIALQPSNASVDRTISLPNEDGTVCLQNSSSCGFLTGAVTDFIQNQNASNQTANFRISGTGQANTSLLSVLFDTPSAVALNVGTTNATAINLNKGTTVTGAFSQSGGSFSLTGSSTSALTVTGSLNMTASGASTWQTTSGDLTIKAAGTSSQLVLDNTSSGGAINIGALTNNARTINVGVGTGGSQTQTVNIGSTGGSSATTINGGTGSGAISLAAGSGGSINATTTGAGNINLNTASSIIGKTTTNSASAFQIQGSSSEAIFGVDTTGNSSNLVTNPSFETNTSGWSARAGCTLSRVTTPVLYGGGAGKCTNTATAGAGTNYNLTLSSSTQYTVSFYAKAAGTFSTFSYGYAQDGSDEAISGLSRTAQTVNSTGWTRYTLTFTTGTVSGTPYFFFKQTDSSAHDFYIDGVQVEAGSSASAYVDGRLTTTGAITSSVIIQPTENSSTALAVYTASGGQAFNVNTLNNRVGVGTLNAAARLHVTNNTASVPTEIVQAASSQSADIWQIQDANNNVLSSVSSAGAPLFKVSTDSTTAFRVQNSNSINQLTVDSTLATPKIIIGPSAGDTVGTLLVLGNKTNSGDPTGTNGAMYYNASTHSFRCYINGGWYGCLGGMRYAQTFSNSNNPPAGDTVTSTTATSFSDAYTVPANDCTPGRVYRITAGGVYSSGTNTDFALNILWGATTVALSDTGASMPPSMTSQNWYLEAILTCFTNASSQTAIEARGHLSASQGSAAPPQLVGIKNNSAGQSVSTGSSSLALQMDWVNTGNSITLRTFVVEALGP